MKKNVSAKKESAKKSVRLSTIVVPLVYNLTLEPTIEQSSFTGFESIRVQVKKTTKTITLHAKDIEIENVSIVKGKKRMVADALSYDIELETVTIHFTDMLVPGVYTLELSFSGVLTDTMRGFYTSTYTVEGKKRTMAVTQFEATDARRAFPCFDEPTFKAVFVVHLVVPKNKEVISNTLPVSTCTHNVTHKVVSFAPTPKMSTYLLAFLVGDFEWVSKKTKRGVLVRVITVPGKKQQGMFALDVGVRCIEFYEDYFGIPYPLNTLDMIAVPDFASAAMENWGAVTYRETALLIDSKNSATAVQAYVAEVIAHELAHQWFGNLVTMEWWTDLWLNEGFATYVPYLALDALFPEWQGWNQFVTTPLAEALKMDSLQNTHPIEVEVYHPNEISEIFDAVSYQKGASIIRMLAEYIGSKHFQKGLQRYLKKHAYGNAKTTDLWESFEHVSKKPVQKMMSIWTRKSGYPVLEVMRTNKNLKLRQKRFLSSVVHAQSVKDSTIWPIPLSIVSSQGEKSVGLFAKKQIQLPWDIQGWFKCNARETGLYRAAYDAATLAMFSGALKSGQLSPVDRLGIIRDLFVLSEVGSYDTVSALTMLMAYRNETEYIVLLEVVSGLRHLEILLHGTPAYKPFCEFACRILSQQLSEVTWIPIQNESHEDSLKRSLILAAGVSFGHAKTILDGVQLFQKKKIQDIHPDVRLAVYRAVARHGGAVAYNKMLTLFKKETLSEEKNRLLAGLCSFSHPDFVLRTLKLGASDEIRLQDKVRVYMNLFADPSAHDIAWNFFKKEWPKMVRMYGDGNHLISRIVLSLGRCGTAHLYKDIKNFFAKTSAPGAERSVRQMLEHIESNVRWRAREAKKIEKWLNQEQSHND